MNRAAAINFARVGAQKMWAGTVHIHPDAKTGAHHHGALESVIYVVRGRARMRWGEKLEYVAEAGPGDFIFVPPYVPHQEINASTSETLECVLVRSDNEAVVVNLDIEPVEKPEAVHWVDPIHKHPHPEGGLMHDLVLRGGRVIDPGTGRDEVADVAFAGGRVAAVGAGLRGTRERDVVGCIVMPGNIDFHTHVYWGGTSISIDADALARRCGNDDLARRGVGRGRAISPVSASTSWSVSQTRILAYLHVGHAGIFAFSHDGDGGREPGHAADGHRQLRRGGAGEPGPDPRHQGAGRRKHERRQRDRAVVSCARGGGPGRAAGDVPHRPAAAALHRRAGGVAARRHADALLQAVPERAVHAPTAGSRRRAGRRGSGACCSTSGMAPGRSISGWRRRC